MRSKLKGRSFLGKSLLFIPIKAITREGMLLIGTSEQKVMPPDKNFRVDSAFLSLGSKWALSTDKPTGLLRPDSNCISDNSWQRVLSTCNSPAFSSSEIKN